MLTGDTRNFGIGDEVAVPIRPRPTLDVTLPKPLPGGMDAKIPDAERRGREAIIVDEWGPYDWKSPKLWPEGRSDATPLKLRVLGPAGEWKVASVRGATIEPVGGPRARRHHRHARAGRSHRLRRPADLYAARAVVGPRGETRRGGRAVCVRLPPVLRAGRLADPLLHASTRRRGPTRTPTAFARVLAGAPVKTERRDRLDYMSGGAIADGLPRDRVALVAEAEIDLPPGNYTLRTISDDGIRVWMDDERIIDRWTPHESAIDTVPVTGGKRRFKVEYYEIGGFAELRFEILRR